MPPLEQTCIVRPNIFHVEQVLFVIRKLPSRVKHNWASMNAAEKTLLPTALYYSGGNICKVSSVTSCSWVVVWWSSSCCLIRCNLCTRWISKRHWPLKSFMYIREFQLLFVGASNFVSKGIGYSRYVCTFHYVPCATDTCLNGPHYCTMLFCWLL